MARPNRRQRALDHLRERRALRGMGYSDESMGFRGHPPEEPFDRDGQGQVGYEGRRFDYHRNEWHPTHDAAVGINPNYRGRGPKGYQRSDDRILEDVCDRLTDDEAVDASAVTVHVNNGEVTLRGSVNSRAQKHAAEDSAEGVSGVRDVINQLRVRDSLPS